MTTVLETYCLCQVRVHYTGPGPVHYTGPLVTSTNPLPRGCTHIQSLAETKPLPGFAYRDREQTQGSLTHVGSRGPGPGERPCRAPHSCAACRTPLAHRPAGGRRPRCRTRGIRRLLMQFPSEGATITLLKPMLDLFTAREPCWPHTRGSPPHAWPSTAG